MAAAQGEEIVATLFGDIHYFYSSPSATPPHHRFDKGSYVYLFENASARRARIEVANQPGTDDQDAFEGFLDKVHVQYSYKHHCMVTLTVGETHNQNEWHLPTYDPHNRDKYHYPLHSLDIYFWTQKDALQFLNNVRRILPPSQVDVQDEPGPPPLPAHSGNEASSVVQQLERVAITDPAYSPEPAQQQHFSPPPISAVPGSEPAQFVPMAYNPAAPAAPEQIRHREKTPPREEDEGVNPLAAAVAVDYQQGPFSPGFAPGYHPHPGAGLASPGLPPHPGSGLASPGLPHQGLRSPGFAPPPQFAGPPAPAHAQAMPGHPGLQRAATMPAHALASPGLTSPYGAGGFPASPGFPPHAQGHPTPPVTSPGLPPPPPGGYAQFSYSQAQPQAALPATAAPRQDYSIHQQVYRPTEGETAVRYQPKQEQKGKLEENAARLERGMTGMFKKFEKKFG